MILRQDLIDLEQIRQITQLELLVELLRERVGSPVSVNALAEELHVDDSTVRRWLTVLEHLYVIFRLSPWHKNVARGTKKAGKYYFYDCSLPTSGVGAIFENLVAGALLKEVEFQREVNGREISLHYVRNHTGVEIDFAVVEDRVLSLACQSRN